MNLQRRSKSKTGCLSPKPRAIVFSHESSIDRVLRKLSPNGRNLIRKVDMEQITSHQSISTLD